MPITINLDKADDVKLTLAEVSLLLFFSLEKHQDQLSHNLLKREFIKRAPARDLMQRGVKFTLTDKGKELLESIIEKNTYANDKLLSLAESLKEIFPKGKKEGTNNYWTDSVVLIKKRLELFFRKYGNNFTNEQIITATKNYVSSFNGNYKFMRTLRYFILKEDRGSGNTESSSELLTYIENLNQEDFQKDNDWTTKLI